MQWPEFWKPEENQSKSGWGSKSNSETRQIASSQVREEDVDICICVTTHLQGGGSELECPIPASTKLNQPKPDLI